MKKYSYIIILLTLATLWRCSPTQHATRRMNYSYMYSGDETAIKPSFKIYNFSPDSSTIYFRITTDELLYAKIYNDSTFNAALSVKYHIKSLSDEDYSDSATINFTQKTLDKESKWLIGKFTLYTPQQSKYELGIKLTDSHRNHFYIANLILDKSNNENRQNYLVLNKDSQLVFDNYLAKEDTVTVISNHPLNRIFIRYYENNFPPALPPFVDNGVAQFSMKTPHVKTINIHGKSTFRFFAAENGIYHIQSDTSQNAGLTFFNFGDHFPRITTVAQMCKSLRYLTSQKEYNDLENAGGKEQKIQLDKFWMGIAGNYDRGRKIIRNYYSRVEDANKFFTSYQQGWRTDRGLIYIIYGPPNIIYRNKDTENWIYGQEDNSLSTNFEFSKIQNPFTDNDYTLIRSINYKNSWFRSVELWREGRVFN